VPKTSEVLASELRRQIMSSGLPTGAPLPTERDLIAQTGLSRSSVREALKILAAENLITTRPGRFGGTATSRPDDESLGRSISLFVHGRGITLAALLQAREAIEPPLAALAATSRTEEELKTLVQVTQKVEDAVDDLPTFLHENVNWHIAIAAASHNELLRAFMSASAKLIYKATSIDNFTTPDVRSQVIQAHRRILKAIVEQDADAARRRMARHLAATTAAMRELADAPLEFDLQPSKARREPRRS
jgi:DNA-binding FadR family transcriptional regulator